MSERGFDLKPGEHPIIPVMLGDAKLAALLGAWLGLTGLGLTVAIAVIFSLIVARLITPMMAAYLMRAKDAGHEEGRDGWIMRGYTWLARVTMRLRYLTLLAMFFKCF